MIRCPSKLKAGFEVVSVEDSFLGFDDTFTRERKGKLMLSVCSKRNGGDIALKG